MIEVAADTDPLNPLDSPRARGDFVFLEPYNNPADPPVPPLEPDPLEDTLVFSTNIQFADVYFLVDCTGSMGGEIANLRHEGAVPVYSPAMRDERVCPACLPGSQNDLRHDVRLPE